MDLINQKFGRLTILKRNGTKGKHALWLCLCECGKKRNFKTSHLTSKKDGVKSCGCLKSSLMQGEMITCKVCGLNKTHKDFYYKQKSKSKTRHNSCKECMKPINNKKKQDRDKANRLITLIHYGGNPPKCSCCREKHVEFLVFDHIDGGGNAHSKQIKKRKLHIWLRLNNFPSGFRVLCSNCNSSFGSYGYCPHQKHGSKRIPI